MLSTESFSAPKIQQNAILSAFQLKIKPASYFRAMSFEIKTANENKIKIKGTFLFAIHMRIKNTA